MAHSIEEMERRITAVLDKAAKPLSADAITAAILMEDEIELQKGILSNVLSGNFDVTYVGEKDNECDIWNLDKYQYKLSEEGMKSAKDVVNRAMAQKGQH